MKRKRYPKNFKEQLIKEAQEVGNALSVAKRHGVSVKTLYRWIQDSKHKAWEETGGNAKKVAAYIPSPQEFRQMEKENNTLKKLLGEKDLEIYILRDLVKKTRPGAFRQNRNSQQVDCSGTCMLTGTGNCWRS